MNERESEPNSGPQPDCPTDKTPSSPPSSFEGRPDTRLPSMSMENLLRRIESPAMKMAREMAKSPLDRLMPSIDHLTSVKEGLRSNVLGEFRLPQTPGIEAIKSAIEDHTASALSVLSGVPDELKEALRQYDSALRQIEAITAPLRAQSELLEAITAYIPKEVLAASQEAQWFNTISRFSGPHTPSTLGNSLEILLRDFGVWQSPHVEMTLRRNLASFVNFSKSNRSSPASLRRLVSKWRSLLVLAAPMSRLVRRGSRRINRFSARSEATPIFRIASGMIRRYAITHIAKRTSTRA